MQMANTSKKIKNKKKNKVVNKVNNINQNKFSKSIISLQNCESNEIIPKKKRKKSRSVSSVKEMNSQLTPFSEPNKRKNKQKTKVANKLNSFDQGQSPKSVVKAQNCDSSEIISKTKKRKWRSISSVREKDSQFSHGNKRQIHQENKVNIQMLNSSNKKQGLYNNEQSKKVSKEKQMPTLEKASPNLRNENNMIASVSNNKRRRKYKETSNKKQKIDSQNNIASKLNTPVVATKSNNNKLAFLDSIVNKSNKQKKASQKKNTLQLNHKNFANKNSTNCEWTNIPLIQNICNASKALPHNLSNIERTQTNFNDSKLSKKNRKNKTFQLKSNDIDNENSKALLHSTEKQDNYNRKKTQKKRRGKILHQTAINLKNNVQLNKKQNSHQQMNNTSLNKQINNRKDNRAINNSIRQNFKAALLYKTKDCDKGEESESELDIEDDDDDEEEEEESVEEIIEGDDDEMSETDEEFQDYLNNHNLNKV